MSNIRDQFFASILFYPTLFWNILLGRFLGLRNWWDEVDENIVLGAYPFENDVSKLAALGIGGVVNTCAEYPGPVAAYQQHEIEQLRIPTVDFTHPTLDSLERATAFITEQVRSGKRVYVHCKAGRARSATVVACWLIMHNKMTAIEAQKKMLSVRSHINPRIYKRPVVQEFERKHLIR